MVRMIKKTNKNRMEITLAKKLRRTKKLRKKKETRRKGNWREDKEKINYNNNNLLWHFQKYSRLVMKSSEKMKYMQEMVMVSKMMILIYLELTLIMGSWWYLMKNSKTKIPKSKGRVVLPENRKILIITMILSVC